MFRNPERRMHTSSALPLQDLTPIASEKMLLDEPKRAHLLQSIIEYSAFDLVRFESLGLKLINRFTHYCQSLPETINKHYALPGGMLDHVLNRTEAALQLFRQLTLQGAGSTLSEEQQLWLYALFSASILQGIGKLVLDYRINLFDVKRQLLHQWNPLIESMASRGRFYQYEFIQEGDPEQRRPLNILLAHKLMPESGFNWIAGNPDVLAAWLALLNEDTNGAGMLGLIFERAEAIALQRDLEAFLTRFHANDGAGRPGRIGTFIDKTPESNADFDRVIGAEFIKWLSQALENGRFVVNKVPLMILPAGLQINTDVFQFFLRENPEKIKNWQVVRNGLVGLGVHLPHFEHKESASKFLLNHFAIALPETMQLHDPVSNTEHAATAIEILRLHQSPNHPQPIQHLNHSGTWQAVEANTLTHQTGFSRRE